MNNSLPSNNPSSKIHSVDILIIKGRILTVAKLLASPIRRDRIAGHHLPRSLLLKFTIFQSEENYWLMPADLPPYAVITPGVGFRGVYARLNRRFITELSAKPKRAQTFVPEQTSPAVRKNLVWREGMREWIEGVLRAESWKRLDGLPRKFLFGCEVQEGLGKVVVGKNIGKRIRLKETTTGTEGVEGESAQTEISQTSSEVPESQVETEAADSTGPQTVDTEVEAMVPDDNKREGPITAVLYLPNPDTTDTWDFKPIDVEGQDTQAVMFNLRHLFPLTAESYMALRLEQGNALAVMSSEMSCTILYHILRLALYLEPAESDILEESVDINPLETKNED
jgi:hypothetical protein